MSKTCLYLFALLDLHNSVVGEYLSQVFHLLTLETVNVPQRCIDKLSENSKQAKHMK
jgi:hypothetical protein